MINPFTAIARRLDYFASLPTPEPRATPERSIRALAGGRVSLDSEIDTFGAWRTVLAPESPDDTWRIHSLDTSTLDRLSPARLMELLSDLSPEISRALWDFLRMCNPGWECKAFRPGTDTIDTPAQAALDVFWERLNGYYGAADSQINRLFMSAFLRGALLSELVLDKAGRLPIDLAVIDPYVVSHRRKDDPDRGPVWQLCQRQNMQLVDLDRPTILYIPVDPLPGKPQGRAIANPAIFTAIFGLAMLHDIRRVVQQQGWPRIDLEIDLEQILLMLSAEEQSNPTQLGAAVAQAVSDIQSVYEGLEPDDAYVHPSAVKVNRPVGTVDSSSLGAIDGLFKALERMSVRALKTTPLMLGISETTNEASSNRQWEIYAQGIKSLQHLAETMIGRLLELGLQAQGIVATVEFRFAELRVAELLRDAQVENLNSQVAKFQYDQGWIDQDAAAMKGAGVAKADQPEPRIASTDTPSNQVGGTPDPGADRSIKPEHRNGKVTILTGGAL